MKICLIEKIDIYIILVFSLIQYNSLTRDQTGLNTCSKRSLLICSYCHLRLVSQYETPFCNTALLYSGCHNYSNT